MSFLLIYFQRRFLFWLFQTQVSFSVLNISYLITSETPSTDIQSMITRGGILVGIVLVLEVLLLYGFSLYFFTAFWLWFRRKIFFKRDLLLVLGYLVLIGGTIYASAVVITETIDLGLTIGEILNQLSPQQLTHLTNEWRELLFQLDLSLEQLPAALAYVSEQSNIIISSVQEIAGIPSLLHDWFVFLINMKSTYLLLLIVSFMILSLGHLFWIGSTNFSLKGLRWFPRKKDIAEPIHPVEQPLDPVVNAQVEKEMANTPQPKKKKKKNKKNNTFLDGQWITLENEAV